MKDSEKLKEIADLFSKYTAGWFTARWVLMQIEDPDLANTLKAIAERMEQYDERLDKC